MTLTKDQTSLLLYVEACVVDDRGYLDSRKMNADDFALLRDFIESGVVKEHPDVLPSGRVPRAVIEGRVAAGTTLARYKTTRVVLTDEGWRLAHEARRARGERAAEARP